MKKAKSFVTNLVFLRGTFEIKSHKIQYDRKNKKTLKLVRGGNRLEIYLHLRTFSFWIKRYIFDYLQNEIFCNLVKKEIDPFLKKGYFLNVKSIKGRLCNFQTSISIENCTRYVFQTKILSDFCEKFQIQKLDIAQEEAGCPSQAKTSDLTEFFEGKQSFLFVNISGDFIQINSETKRSRFKFQINDKEKLLHVSLILTNYTNKEKDLISWLLKLKEKFKK